MTVASAKSRLRKVVERMRAFVARIQLELAVWRLVLKDKRTPWLAKALIWFAVGYALMPFDLIPDFVPVLGYLDDVVMVGVPMAIAIRMVPRWSSRMRGGKRWRSRRALDGLP